jgi:hypothetical protein
MKTPRTAKPTKTQQVHLSILAHNEANGFFTHHHSLHQHTVRALYARGWVEDVTGPTRGRLTRLTDAGRAALARMES